MESGIKESAINLRQLRYFTRIVEAGSITRAAEQLFVAQPALGMQIKQLEEDLGVELLQRHSRGASATRAGQVLYERACEILRLVEEAERQVVAAGRFATQSIVLGLTNGFVNLAGRDLVLRARERLPGVKLEIVEERSLVLLDALERHEIDVALAYEVRERPSLMRVPLIEEELFFVSQGPGGSQACAEPPIEFAELVRRELVLPRQRDGVRQQVLATAKRMALELRIVEDVSSISLMKEMVARGDAASVMPYGNAVDDIENGRLRGRRIVNPTVKRTLYLVRSLTRAAFEHEEAFLTLLSQSVSQVAQRMGPLATRLDPLDRPLGQTLAELRSRGHSLG
ncbi:LysR family transcriptional regulator [Azohydromonas australica]|uniref:LysR family transcriptional regulator n=1 Tax=Azohydromonas australica TaxID=364039 RepID=UPI000406BA7E|nr:LysR substrate-binding domain-containing protein [Azohydromonas australica]